MSDGSISGNLGTDQAAEIHVRLWRVSGVVVPFPKRQVVIQQGDGPMPQQIGWETRVPTAQRIYDDVVVAIRPLAEDSPLREVVLAGPMALQVDAAELVILVPAPTVEAVRERIDTLVELLLEHLSFQVQTALSFQHLVFHDVTAPVSVGDNRDMATQAGFMIDKFMKDAAMGSIEIADSPQLADGYPEPQPKLRQALGWYVKSLSTAFTADQYIFLWIAIDLFRGMSGVSVQQPYHAPCGHEITHCPVCNKPVTREVQGASVQKYFTERWNVDPATARRLWTARQIMHGAVPFDSAVMTGLGELVQILRAVVAAELKLQYSLADTDPPCVTYGAISINPDSMGLFGTSQITNDDLAWPSRQA